MNGQISAHPFVELLREISHSKLSGAIRLEHDRIRAVVYFETGDPVFAASNVKSLRLGEYLTKQELISAEKLSAIPNNRSDTLLAKELLKQGLVEEAVLNSAFTSLVTDLLRVAILWAEGTWIYDSQTQLADSNRVKVPTTNLLLEGARKMGLKLVSSRLSNPAELISPAGQKVESERLLPQEGFVLSRVDRPLPLSEVITLSGQRELDALRTVYGLVLSDYLRREVWPTALFTETAEQGPAVVTPPIATMQPQKTEAEELAEFFGRVEGAANYYEVLNIDQRCNVEDIKRSYYMLARRYHPDRFHSRDVHGRTENAFARITQAYETLIDSADRQSYDAKLAAQQRSQQLADLAPKGKVITEVEANAEAGLTAEQRAENSFREGYAALRLGQANAAVPHLASAARSVPDEPRYRAFYGQALAMQGNSQRLAELELSSAVRLDPSNVTYRLMLANLYFQLKFYKRSLAEVERVLAIEPRNDKAEELMTKIDTERKINAQG